MMEDSNEFYVLNYHNGNGFSTDDIEHIGYFRKIKHIVKYLTDLHKENMINKDILKHSIKHHTYHTFYIESSKYTVTTYQFKEM